MQVSENIFLIRKDFMVTPVVKRYVNIYLICGNSGYYLVDSGVAGTESLVAEFMQSIGANLKDIKGLLLTHSHPDHIGAANQIKKASGCKVYAPSKELDWIENIENQFRDRPIPNFHQLLAESVQVDVPVEDGQVIGLEKGLEVKCVATAGHSHGSMSYLLNGTCLFIGDAIPVVTDLPIFVDYEESVCTIQRLRNMKNVEHFCPAWDCVYSQEKFESVTEASLKMLHGLKNAAMEVAGNGIEDGSTTSQNSADGIRMILEKAGLLQFAGNPLVARSIEACLK